MRVRFAKKWRRRETKKKYHQNNRSRDEKHTHISFYNSHCERLCQFFSNRILAHAHRRMKKKFVVYVRQPARNNWTKISNQTNNTVIHRAYNHKLFDLEQASASHRNTYKLACGSYRMKYIAKFGFFISSARARKNKRNRKEKRAKSREKNQSSHEIGNFKCMNRYISIFNTYMCITRIANDIYIQREHISVAHNRRYKKNINLNFHLVGGASWHLL